jgi:hypothetical protein
MHSAITALSTANFDFWTTWVQVKYSLREYVPPAWVEFKSDFLLLIYFLATVAAISALWRLKWIVELVKEIRASRGNIWDLRGLAKTMHDGAVSIKTAIDDMNSVLSRIAESDLAETLKIVQKQLADIQRNSADESAELAAEDPTSKSVKEQIRKDWTEARDNLDEIIEGIGDRRTKNRYTRLNRRSYTNIIYMLLTDKIINDATAEAAEYMNSIFLRRTPISYQELQKFNESKKSFDKHIKSFKPQLPFPSSPAALSANGRQRLSPPQV